MATAKKAKRKPGPKPGQRKVRELADRLRSQLPVAAPRFAVPPAAVAGGGSTYLLRESDRAQERHDLTAHQLTDREAEVVRLMREEARLTAELSDLRGSLLALLGNEGAP